MITDVYLAKKWPPRPEGGGRGSVAATLGPYHSPDPLRMASADPDEDSILASTTMALAPGNGSIHYWRIDLEPGCAGSPGFSAFYRGQESNSCCGRASGWRACRSIP